MGILNLTPDSFYAESRTPHVEQALARAEVMLEAGADILDLGAESTRPGATPISEEDELDRLLPVLIELRKRHPAALISIDTSHTSIARTALAHGADIINDVHACSPDDGMWACIAESGAGYIVMHSRGTPQTMDLCTSYEDVVREVSETLEHTCLALVANGVCSEQLVIDPGLGFAKTHADSLLLLRAVQHFAHLRPTLIGASRKRFLAPFASQKGSDPRLAASITAALWAAMHGAAILRVHDIEATRDMLSLWSALHED